MRFARRVLAIMAITSAAFYVAVCVALFVFQRSLLYYPHPGSNRGSSEVMPLSGGAETVVVSTHPHDGSAAVIYFGGNAEDVSQVIPDLVEAFPDSAIYALHYPGYGGSSGSPSQQTIFAASLALIDRVRGEHPYVVIVGRSLGSGVAVWVASQRPVARLVVITPFDSIADVAAAQYPWAPVRLLLRDRFESGRYASHVTAPTRIVVAADDELVPRSSSDRLRTRFHDGVAEYVVVPGARHNTIQDAPGYWAMVARN